ncbi:MAG: hypothetical protein IKQ54_11385 [Oscillospiraceae bacterium]|nr:hypothetical protein [Oscillospiraceae bacterium]
MPKPVNPRYQTLEEFNEAALSEHNVDRLQHKLSQFLYDTLGIRMEDDGSVPSSDDYPRIFVMAPDKDGGDLPQDLNASGIRPGTREFMEQVQKGNVFAYPVGKTKPVQLQIKLVKGDANFAFSDPIEPEQIPEPPHPPKPLTGWRKFLNKLLFFPFRREKLAHDNYRRQRANATSMLQQIEQQRTEIAEQEVRQFQEEKDAAALNEQIKRVKLDMDAADLGKKNFVDTFQPVPVKREDMLKNPEGHPLGGNYAFYTEEQFRNLTILTADEAEVKNKLRDQDEQIEQRTIDQVRSKGLPEKETQNLHPDKQAGGKQYQFRAFDQNSIVIKGKPLTNAQFAAVALASCFQIKHVKQGHAVDSKQFDPYLEQSMKDMGYPEKDAEMIAHLNFRSMGTTDLFIIPPRDKEGYLIKDYLNPARLDAADAFEAYKNGNLKPLAELLANGINEIARESCDQSSDRLNVQGRGAIMMGEELLNLMRQDPELAKQAVQNGMEQDKLECVQGLVKIQKLEQAAKTAEYQILTAKQEKRSLTETEKKDYAEQIVNFKLCMQQLKLHADLVAEAPESEYVKFVTNSTAKMQKAPPDPDRPGFPLPKGQRKAPPKGSMYEDSLSDALGGVRMLYTPQPEFVRLLSDPVYEQKVREFSGKLVKDEHVDALNDEAFYQQIKLTNGSLKLSKHLNQLTELMADENDRQHSQSGVRIEAKKENAKHTNPRPGSNPHV